MIYVYFWTCKKWCNPTLSRIKNCIKRGRGTQQGAQINEQPGEGRQLGAQIFEDPRERWDQKDGHPQEHQDGDGLAQGSLDLVLKFGVVFQQLGQSLQGLIQYAASFPGFHHGDAELIKHLRPLA